MPEHDYKERNEVAVKAAAEYVAKNRPGWIARTYFGSQNSFFTKNGKQYARCTIERWE
jgi:hypothetical protein